MAKKKFVKPPVPEYLTLKVRIWDDLYPEMAVQDYEDEDSFSGWSDILVKHPMRETVLQMLQKRSKKIAKEIYQHEKESIRFLSALILNDVKFDIEKRKGLRNMKENERMEFKNSDKAIDK